MIDAAPPAVTDAELTDLLDRVRGTRRIHDPWSADATRGLGGQRLDALLDYWGNGYDWRTHESRIRELPWTATGTGRGSVRLIHQQSSAPSATTVVLLHGWPDSVLRFERVLPLLTDVNVVIPALPGFPFSAPLAEGMSTRGMADVVATALEELGYERYVLSGGDVGGTVAEIMAAEHPDRVMALHLTNVSPGHAAAVAAADLAPEALAYLGSIGEWRKTEAGFIAEQSTRPSTVIASLGDSPAGLLAWIGEKLLGWSDSTTGVDAFTADELLTWVSAYWLTGTIGTSFSTYVQPARLPERVEIPTVISAFLRDIIPAPLSFTQHFVDVREFVEHGSGGHFAAWEKPELYAADLRSAVTLASQVASLS